MLSEGEKLDELLSGYVDGALSDAERELVERAARDDARIAQHLLQLLRQADLVRELGRQLVRTVDEERSVRSGRLAERVLAQAREQARGLGLAPDHFVFGDQSVVAAASHAAKPGPGNRAVRKWVSWGMVAAAVVLAVAVPWWRTQEPTTVATATGDLREERSPAESNNADHQSPDLAAIEEPLPAATLARKGAGGAEKFGNLTFVLVADVQMTATAYRQQVLERVLNVSGITQVAPVPASPEVIKTLDEALVILPDQKQDATQPLLLMVVHAQNRDLDSALQAMWQDERHFPRVGLNLATDARATLAREILKSASGRLNLSESFAVPLTTNSDASQLALGSPLSGNSSGERFVSSATRSAGWGGTTSLAAGAGQATSTLLLVVHLVD